MFIRFDDCRPGHERSFGFSDPVEVLATVDPSGVREVVATAEQRARSGSWVAGFLSYEAAPGLDPVLSTHPPAGRMPLAWFGVFDDRQSDPPWPARGTYLLGEWLPDVGTDDYRSALEHIHRYIEAGDTYQVNFTLRLRAPFSGDPVTAYRDLLAAQAGGFGAFLDLGNIRVLSASPELFFRWGEDGIATRPMKGTARRGRWPQEDEELRVRLNASEKERAENLMIVDLLRNDLGRIAEYGSVEATNLFETERYETLWQMTSTIRARPPAHTELLDVLTALFPSGSVTGAPKARTMEIIRELETSPRGLYCGAIGLLAPPGSGEPRAQFNVAIRTLVVDGETGTAEYGTGGGITWDSEIALEHGEAILKAAVLTRRLPPFSLLETMRWSPAEGIIRRRAHVDRLAASAGYFGFPFPAADVASALDGLAAGYDLRVRLLVDRAGSVTVETAPLGEQDEPLRLVIDTGAVDPRNVFLFHKTTHRQVYEEAAKRHPEADDVILVNDAGLATETTRANLAVRRGDEWVTPPLADGCLPGTLRSELISSGRLRERSIPAGILHASELVVISSLRGWRRAELMG